MLPSPNLDSTALTFLRQGLWRDAPSDRRELQIMGATGGLPAGVRVPIGDRHARAGKLPVAPGAGKT